MSLPVVFAPEAKTDVEEAADYYEIQNPGLGESFLRSLDAGIARIQRFPEGFRSDERDVRTALPAPLPLRSRCPLPPDCRSHRNPGGLARTT